MNPSFRPAPAISSLIWMTPAQCQVIEAAGTTAYRLASGPGGWVERLGDDVIISYKQDTARDEMAAGLASWCAKAGWQPVRVFHRHMPIKNADRISPVLHSGDATLPLTTVVTEAGIRYGLDIGASYSHGLFLDQRLNRAKLHSLKPKRVLNTFAYTCSFSVVAALAGAETVSVDLSRKSLDRGRENFKLNRIDESRHSFIADDTMELLAQQAARGERFDAIVLDPPTFSRSKTGRRWQVEDHFEDLLDAALAVAAPKCSILLSTNCTKLDPTALERRARWCAKGKRRSADYVKLGTPVDFPPGHGSSTLWMMLR
ncbi:class I SAM-dependent methyltransferase [Prosthecobacter sp.]|uniref:class I SAM-dependent methyltransferase n=1 Tax=Prosthecobacter sp. TaxID=1965333 RepID=UPI003783E98C